MRGQGDGRQSSLSLMINSCAERALSLTHSIKASEHRILQCDRGYRAKLHDLLVKGSLIYEQRLGGQAMVEGGKEMPPTDLSSPADSCSAGNP